MYQQRSLSGARVPLSSFFLRSPSLPTTAIQKNLPKPTRILSLSNGHGEDEIAVRILEALRQFPDAPDIVALPLVGEGHAYQKARFPVIGAVKPMPSGGFIYMDGQQLVRDLQGGLLQLTLTQLQTIQHWAQEGRGKRGQVCDRVESSLILAVGDIVPLLFAGLSGAPFAFVGTAKSEYYVRTETGPLPRRSPLADLVERWTGCVYYPWERWLMKQPRCRAIFPRDSITAERLQRFNLPAFDLGNPMMDGLEWAGEQNVTSTTALKILLLPGSRAPEAYVNWQLIVKAVCAAARSLNRPIDFLAAIAPGLDQTQLHHVLVEMNWAQQAPSLYQWTESKEQATLTLATHRFAEFLHIADLAIAMAGTATEQFVGFGKPAITLVGEGPQFTAAFAEAQTRLLGESVTLLANPDLVPNTIQTLLQDGEGLQQIAANGQRRMGKPGAAQRIAACLLTAIT